LKLAAGYPGGVVNIDFTPAGTVHTVNVIDGSMEDSFSVGTTGIP
jgi:hypothetical protein